MLPSVVPSAVPAMRLPTALNLSVMAVAAPLIFVWAVFAALPNAVSSPVLVLNAMRSPVLPKDFIRSSPDLLAPSEMPLPSFLPASLPTFSAPSCLAMSPWMPFIDGMIVMYA